MHREISHADEAFQQESRSSLYLFTALLGLLIAADLGPLLFGWLERFGLWLPTWPREVGGFRWALFAAILGGARALYGSIDSLLQGKLGADLALAIACVAAILVREPLVAAEIVFVGLLGECLENLTFERTRQAVRKIVEICPRRCWRIRDGQEERILTTELQAGDVVVVKPGGRIPADGVVLDGRSAVDVSPLTGESLPLDRGPGDEVLAGSLNQAGALTIEARRVAEQTLVGRVIELTARALKDKAPAERTADRLARYFLPTVLGVALLTFLVGFLIQATGLFRPADAPRLGLYASARLATYPALSVLVVACPCALILATPAAIIAALGRLAGTGVLLKGGSALERLASIDTVFFDKTGTLTEGRLELGEIALLPGNSVDERELLRLAACAEQRSEHPLARLLVEEAQQRRISLDPVEDFEAYPGSGVSARIGEQRFLVGNRRLLQEQGVELPAEMDEILARLDAVGQTVLLVCRDEQVLGAIGARDRVRPEAAKVILELRRLGITSLTMLTGDRTAVAQAVASQIGAQGLGLSEIHAELLPQDKADRVAEAQARGQKVAMVGDGINDAPALARAQVGIAIGGSADVAAEAGDVVLMIGSTRPEANQEAVPLQTLPFLLRLSRQTVRVIRQNILIFAFGVNGVGVLLTSWLWPILTPGAWYEHGPLAAVIYHQIGSLAVLLNAMRLLWFERGGHVARIAAWEPQLARVNRWLESLDVDEGIHWLAHHWKVVAAGILGVLLVWYGLSGLMTIGPDEVGIVRRFGRPLSEDLGPGLHLRWPAPIEIVTRLKPGRIQTIEIGFRSLPGLRGYQGARGWASLHGGDGVRRVQEEAVMITGDGNLLELQGSIRYTIASPRTYLFGVADAELALRDSAESVLREVVAGHGMEQLLTGKRAWFQTEVHSRLVKRCPVEGPNGLGLRIEGVSLHDLHPPQEVVQSYHEVTRAMELRDRLMNEAEMDRVARRHRQEADSLQTIRQAEAERYSRLALANAKLADFQARQSSRSRLSLSQEWILLSSALTEFGQGLPENTIAQNYLQKRRAALALQESLTDFRLYWDRVGEALAGRSKVVIDAEKVPGRRLLWMLPTDIFPPPAVISERPRREGRRPSNETTPGNEP